MGGCLTTFKAAHHSTSDSVGFIELLKQQGTMRSILVILSTGLVSAAPQFGNSGQGCNAIGGIINDVFTQGNPASEAIDRQEGENECWCVGVTERGRKGSSRIQNRIVNRPLCGVGETMVCRDEEEEEEVDTAPLMKQDNECSCNGKLNNERLGVQPCESSFRGSAWCYVQPGFCADEITSDTTGKSWSQDACGVQHSANNKEKSNGVNPIVPRLQLQLE